MTASPQALSPNFPPSRLALLITLAAGGALAALFGLGKPHAPKLSLLSAAPLAVQIHVGAALTALAIGSFLMIAPKGTGVHKSLGWTWAAAMATTAGSSFFITGLNGHAYSPIHLLSAWTMIALPMGISFIRRRNVRLHRRTMGGLFFGGLIIAGAFTFVPGRLMFNLFFG